MIGGNSITPKDETVKVSFPSVIGLVIGAFAGAVTWIFFYCLCPKPPILDKFLDLFFAAVDRRCRPGPGPDPPQTPHLHERPSTTAMNDPVRQRRRRASTPSETVDNNTTILFEEGGDYSTPEPPLLDSSEEETD